MPTFSGKRNASRLPKRGVLAVAPTTTLPRRSGRGATPTAPAADVIGTGGAAAADTTGTVCAAAATVNTSSRHSGRNTISGIYAAASTTSSAPNAGSTINAPSSGPSKPSINTGCNLDIHDAATLPVPAILDDNISEYSNSEDDSSVFAISTKKTTSNKNQRKSNPIQGPTGGAAKKDSQSSPRRIAAATSLVNFTVGCGVRERNGDQVVLNPLKFLFGSIECTENGSPSSDSISS
jgi:hypothetical protein